MVNNTQQNMLFFFCFVLVASAIATEPTFDHQVTTYTASHDPVDTLESKMILTPFFSPDHSIDTLVNLIDKANTSLDIMTPSIGSWSGCSYSTGSCIGCTVEAQNAEAFPAFQALLNAVHRGVAIRILTNNFNNVVCSGKIDMANFFALNGIAISWYQSTTFVHAKFVVVDGELASISSVNWSKNSFLNNREAGIVVGGTGASDILNFVKGVFNDDWSAGQKFTPTQTYSASDMAIITSKKTRTIDIPAGPTDRSYTTPTPKAIAGTVSNFTVLTSPDYSFTTILDHLNSATKSLDIYTYQITDTRICDAIEAKYKNGVRITVLVSKAIYGSSDQAAATTCYEQLTKAGIDVHLAWQYDHYMYCHNKYWIVDSLSLGLSTGNLSPSDLPGPPMVFPTYQAGGTSWRDANRDFHVLIEDSAVVDQYMTTLKEDLANSTIFSGGSGSNMCASLGCGYHKGAVCQCNPSCLNYTDCCSDYASQCK
jgi:phosphatidylserine/phosphatidylglycerophosphate/cardiolipin synthase-like enzyme